MTSLKLKCGFLYCDSVATHLVHFDFRLEGSSVEKTPSCREHTDETVKMFQEDGVSRPPMTEITDEIASYFIAELIMTE